MERNHEHYPDPTAGDGIRAACTQDRPPTDWEIGRASETVRMIKNLLRHRGYRLTERIKFEDLTTGRKFE